MARQRPQTKSKSRHASPGGDRSAGRPMKPAHEAQTAPQRRSTYFEAVAIYERGLEALQRHDYRAAAALLESVLSQYPEEKELHERVRLYLNVCKRQVAPLESSPQTVAERLYAATLALNGGQYEEALHHLRLARDEDPDNDHALYMLAVAHAQRGNHAEAVAHLERAIAINPENRALARRDPDLESVHDDEAFRNVVESSGSAKAGLNRLPRSKSAR